MSRPEDTGSRTVEDAAAYERWRAEDDPPDDGHDESADDDACPHRCRCHGASEEPCAYCCGDCCEGRP